MTDQPTSPDTTSAPADPESGRKAARKAPSSSKQPKAARRSRKGTAHNTPEVPRSAFNFIDDIWQHKRAVRKRNLVIAGSTLALLFVVFLAGLFLHAANGTAEVRRNEADFDRELAEVRIREITGGVANLPDHVDARRKAVDGALALDVDSRVVLDRLLETVPAGVQLHSVEVLAAGAGDSAERSHSGDSGGGTSAEASSGDAPTVVAAATETEMGAALRWREQLNSHAFFARAVIVIGANGELTVEAAVADPMAAQTRRAQAAQELGGS